jgi:hypothetical protein
VSTTLPFFYSSALELRVGLAARDKTAASARPSRLRRAHRPGLDSTGGAPDPPASYLEAPARVGAAPTERKAGGVGCAGPTGGTCPSWTTAVLGNARMFAAKSKCVSHNAILVQSQS